VSKRKRSKSSTKRKLGSIGKQLRGGLTNIKKNMKAGWASK